MEPSSTGGRANWAGAAFELRLGVEFCVYILMGEYAGLAPGAARRVQFQAPGIVDDLALEFDGATWAVQAKSGSSVRVEWSPDSPFGKALHQLYRGATSGQVDLAAGSLDRVVLAVDHQADSSITAFGQWLEQARQHYEWQRFAAASTGKKRAWAQKLPAFLDAPADEKLLAFLKHLYVQRAPAPDEWQSELRGRLLREGVPDNDTAERALDLLVAQLVQIAPHAGQRDYEALRRSCEDVPGLPRPGASPFRLFDHPTEDDLYRALHMPPDRPTHFVERPELAVALDSERGVLVAGRPGSGKSHALIKLALARPERCPESYEGWPVLVVARHFRADDLGRLAAQVRRVHSPYQLLWDDVHDKPDLFADALLRLVERGDSVRILAAYREAYEPAVRERVTPDVCRRVRLAAEPVRLQPFDAGQAARMAGVAVEVLGLDLDEAARGAFATHIRRGDGGPLFALSTGRLLQERQAQGEPVRAADVAGLPDELLEVWSHLYERLAGRPNGLPMQGLLGVLHFLYQVDCPLQARLAELLFTRVLDYRRGEFDGAARALAQEGWLRREGDAFAAHDVTLEAVPDDADTFRRCVQFARAGVTGEELALGLLRGSLALFHAAHIPRARTAQERRTAIVEAVELGELAVADFRAARHDGYLATSLNNASGCYSDLAGLEEGRAGRVGLLGQAVAAIEEAVRIRRELGLQADLAMSLNNASLRYSALAGLEEGRAGRVGLLGQAVAAIEEAVRIRRELGLQAELASSLNNVSLRYSDLAGLEEGRAGRVGLLGQAVAAIEEAVRIRRELGLQADLAMSLNNASNLYSDLVGLEEERAGRVGLLGQAVAASEEAAAIYRELGLQADLAMSLNNASGCYSELAGLEEGRAGRVGLLGQAVAAIEEAAAIYRELGLQADLAMSLNNASLRYSDLAGLEEGRAGRVRLLGQAVAAIEEAAAIYRELGLQAELASSLNNAAKAYFGMIDSEDSIETQVEWLRKALQAIQQGVEVFRTHGIIPYLMIGLRNAVILHQELCKHTGELDRTHVLALCREGEALCENMEDRQGLAFFRQVRQQLEGGGD